MLVCDRRFSLAASEKIGFFPAFSFSVLVLSGVYIIFQNYRTVCLAEGFCMEVLQVGEGAFLIANNSYGLPRTVSVRFLRGEKEAMPPVEQWHVVEPWGEKKLADLSHLPRKYQSVRNFIGVVRDGSDVGGEDQKKNRTRKNQDKEQDTHIVL